MFDKFLMTAYAAEADKPSTIKPITEGSASLMELVTKIINVMLIIAGILVVVYLIYMGILYITANGDATKATAARTGIVNAVIGIVVILIAYSVTGWVTRGLEKGDLNGSGGSGGSSTIKKDPVDTKDDTDKEVPENGESEPEPPLTTV